MNRAPRSDHEIRTALKERDETVTAELYDRFGEALMKAGQRNFPRLDPQEIESAILDLILKMWEHPDKYDPDRGKLSAYLKMALRRDLLNRVRKEKTQPDIDPQGVKLLQNKGNDQWREIETRIDRPGKWQRIDQVLDRHFPTEPDRTLVTMMLEGERNRERYAAVMGITDLTGLEWKKTVDRSKDRINKKIKRKNIINIILRIANS